MWKLLAKTLGKTEVAKSLASSSSALKKAGQSDLANLFKKMMTLGVALDPLAGPLNEFNADVQVGTIDAVTNLAETTEEFLNSKAGEQYLQQTILFINAIANLTAEFINFTNILVNSVEKMQQFTEILSMFQRTAGGEII